MSISSILSNDKKTLIYPNIAATDMSSATLITSNLTMTGTIDSLDIYTNANSTTIPAIQITNSSGLALQLVAGGECRNITTYADSTINLEGNEDIIYIDVEGATVSLPSGPRTGRVYSFVSNSGSFIVAPPAGGTVDNNLFRTYGSSGETSVSASVVAIGGAPSNNWCTLYTATFTP